MNQRELMNAQRDLERIKLYMSLYVEMPSKHYLDQIESAMHSIEMADEDVYQWVVENRGFVLNGARKLVEREKNEKQ
jgi:hypothetical protein